MKYSNNNPEFFTGLGSEMSFLLGMCNALIGIYTDLINSTVLVYQKSVEYSIVHFIALHVIMELPKMYMDAMGYTKLKEACKIHPPAGVKGRSVTTWRQRTCFKNMARFIHSFIQSVYVSCIYYFMPFFMMFLTYAFAKIKFNSDPYS